MPKRRKTDASSDDVHDRVDGADFMEVNLFERNVMDGGFGDAEIAEDGRSALLHGRRSEDFAMMSRMVLSER